MSGSINAWWLGRKSMGELLFKISDPLIEILYRDRSRSLILKAKIFDKRTMDQSVFLIWILT
jgi:hypothetical protein